MAVKARYVDTSGMPNPKKEYMSAIGAMPGGLNIRDLSYQLSADESPEMQNLYWKAGSLRSRDGQVYITRRDTNGTGITAYSKLFNGCIFTHSQNGIYYYFAGQSGERQTLLYADKEHTSRGTFFQYQDSLFYKTDGLFLQIDAIQGGFTAKRVEPFIPTITLNADPATGAGDMYQPQNRYTGWREVRYTPDPEQTAPTVYKLPTPIDGTTGVDLVIRADGTTKTAGSDYTINKSTGVVTFVTGKKPTNWDTLDVSIDDKKLEKSYGEDGVTSWDGDTTGKTVVDVSGMSFYHVSSAVPTYGGLLGQTATFSSEDEYDDISGKISDEGDYIDVELTTIQSVPIGFVVVKQDNVEISGVTFQHKGIYFQTMRDDEEGIDTFTSGASGYYIGEDEKSIKWNGDTSGKYCVTLPVSSASVKFCLVSTDTPTAEELEDATAYVCFSSSAELNSTNVTDATDYILFGVEGLMSIVAKSDGITVSGITFPSKGVYTRKAQSGDSQEWMSSFTWSSSIIKDYSVNKTDGTITFTNTAILADKHKVRVTVSGVTKAETTDYTVAADTGTITFVSGHEPTIVSTDTNYVQIQYLYTDEDGFRSIDDCVYAIVYGGTTGNCIVLGGCGAQPNAYFWNSNDQYDMNPGYWPYDTYQLAGANIESITGFGQQAGELIIFKENSIGKSTMGTQTINEREYIDFPYKNVNRKVGCDCPWSIQLIQNNLVWANTQGGVYYLGHTSPAYENNVQRMSLKINGNSTRNGLLAYLRHAGVDEIVGGDDGDRYWLLVGSRAFVWDYSLSEDSDPAWFYLTGIQAVAFVSYERVFWQLCRNGFIAKHKASYSDWTEVYTETLYYNNETSYTLLQSNDHLAPLRRVQLTANGVTQMQGEDYTINISTGVVVFHKTYAFNTKLLFALEYGDPISKKLVSPTQILGGYDSLKDVTKVIFAFRADAPSTVKVTYKTDYTDHVELPSITTKSWSWVPRNLTHRDLAVHSFATIAVRRNGCKNIRHFAIVLENNNYGEDLAVVSEYIYYKYKGRDR